MAEQQEFCDWLEDLEIKKYFSYFVRADVNSLDELCDLSNDEIKGLGKKFNMSKSSWKKFVRGLKLLKNEYASMDSNRYGKNTLLFKTASNPLLRQGVLENEEEMKNDISLKCSSHPREEALMFCSEDNCPVCTICISSTHKRHRMQTFSECYKSNYDEIRPLLTTSKLTAAKLKSAVAEVDEIASTINENHNVLEIVVTNYFEKCRMILNETEERTLKELETKTMEKIYDLNDQGEALSMVSKELSTSRERLLNSVVDGSKGSVLQSYFEVKNMCETAEQLSLAPLVGNDLVFDSTSETFENLESCAQILDLHGSSAKIEGTGAVKAFPDSTASFKVIVLDREGNPKKMGGDDVTCTITSASGKALRTKLADNRNGTYSVRYKAPEKPETCQILVVVNDVALDTIDVPIVSTLGFSKALGEGRISRDLRSARRGKGNGHCSIVSDLEIREVKTRWDVTIDSLQDDNWIMFGVIEDVEEDDISYRSASNYAVCSNYILEGGSRYEGGILFKQGDKVTVTVDPIDGVLSAEVVDRNLLVEIDLPKGRTWFPHFDLHGSKDRITIASAEFI